MEATSSRPHPQRIALARSLRGLTQEELAAQMGISVFTLGKWERGERSPSKPFMRRLADATNQPIPWFFDEVAAA